MDRRKTVHSICANVLSFTDDALSGIAAQVASPVVAGFPAASTDASALQTLLTNLKTDLNTWYTAWRGPEPPEPPQASFFGVFGTPANFSNALGAVSPVTRMVRNDYAYAGALAMAYEQLYSVALALNKTAPGLTTLALSGLQDIVDVIESLRETMCRVTIRDLHNQDPTISLSLADLAVTDTQSAW